MKRDLAGLRGRENESEVWGEWRRVVQTAGKGDRRWNEKNKTKKNRRPVSMPASSRTSGIKKRAMFIKLAVSLAMRFIKPVATYL